ncbi:hypothetical protein [Thermostichus vulcanus]|uniref:hypothetical protein n=1 Tax=Thermostichus vulcanus TaxID=32053 RepID=UPI001FCC1B52|nr:hypothetical protein [Thermostichus vulcanus]
MVRLSGQMQPGSKPWGLMLSLLGWALTSCGADSLTANTPLPPLITSSDIPSAVSRNGFLELGVSVSVPGRIPAELAFQVSWSGIEVQTLSAAQVNCVSGEVSCTTRFSLRPPLSLVPGSYLLSLRAFDRLGQSAVVTQTVLVTD